MDKLKQLDSHFAFGENWQSYVSTVGEAQIERAVTGLQRLIDPANLIGRHLLDIGCGSGISALAAIRLGAAQVHCTDIDPNSVEASRALFARFAPAARVDFTIASVFDLVAPAAGGYDIVHSWGVLHHTGAMWEAVGKAASIVSPGGRFILALYHRTPLCGFWRAEKWVFSKLPKPIQMSLVRVFRLVFGLWLRARGQSLTEFLSRYSESRGMSWEHDIRDWLGGYPYESTNPQEVDAALRKLGFQRERYNSISSGGFNLLGIAIDEYVYVRSDRGVADSYSEPTAATATARL
jgi:predicted RNA methylase